MTVPSCIRAFDSGDCAKARFDYEILEVDFLRINSTGGVKIIFSEIKTAFGTVFLTAFHFAEELNIDSKLELNVDSATCTSKISQYN